MSMGDVGSCRLAAKAAAAARQSGAKQILHNNIGCSLEYKFEDSRGRQMWQGILWMQNNGEKTVFERKKNGQTA